MPNDLVFNVPSSVDVSALTLILERLVSNEELRRTVGAHARNWADRMVHCQRLCRSIENLLQEFIAVKPLIGLCKRIGRDFSSIGIKGDEVAAQRIALTLRNLFVTTSS